jgi:hypothetical protein
MFFAAFFFFTQSNLGLALIFFFRYTCSFNYELLSQNDQLTLITITILFNVGVMNVLFNFIKCGSYECSIQFY